MSPSSLTVRTTLRILGNWGDPGELIERLPDGFQLTPDWLVTPDGTAIEFTPMRRPLEYANWLAPGMENFLFAQKSERECGSALAPEMLCDGARTRGGMAQHKEASLRESLASFAEFRFHDVSPRLAA